MALADKPLKVPAPLQSQTLQLSGRPGQRRWVGIYASTQTAPSLLTRIFSSEARIASRTRLVAPFRNLWPAFSVPKAFPPTPGFLGGDCRPTSRADRGAQDRHPQARPLPHVPALPRHSFAGSAL